MTRFIDNGDGTITDTKLNLMWTQATVAKGRTHKQALSACKKLDAADHKDWRLPTVDELFSLADRSRINPAIDTDIFPDTENDWYWTSTDSAWSPSAAWIVGFSRGYAAYSLPYGNACVRAVRSLSPGQ